MTATSGADRPTLREILDVHAVAGFTGDETACRCDRKWRDNAEYRDHLADALLPVVERAKDDAAAEALEEAADELDTRAVELWSAYKGAPPTDPRRASPHTEGESDGWENAGTHVRNLAVALRSQGGGT